MRLTLPLLIILSLTILITPTLHATYRYMGGPYPFTPLSDSTLLTLAPGSTALIPVPTVADGEIRLSALMAISSKGTSGFALATDSDTITLTLRELPAADHIYDHDRLTLSIDSRSGTRVSPPTTLPATPDRYRLGKETALTLSLTPATPALTRATLIGGRTQTHELWTDTLRVPFTDIRAIGFTAGTGTPLTVTRATLSTPDPVENDSHIAPRQIEDLLARTTDPYAGYWTILDYTLEDTMLRPGGDYLLALIPAADGGYDIHYLEGAYVAPARWAPGTHKGHLTPTRLPGLYRAAWTDAEGHDLDATATLQFTGTDMATLTVPHLRSTLRLHRLRP